VSNAAADGITHIVATPRENEKYPYDRDGVRERMAELDNRVHQDLAFSIGCRFDVIDIVESEDPEQVARAAMLIRGYGHARTEIPATPWRDFLDSL